MFNFFRHELTKKDLYAITEAIRSAELKTSGEIRVEIRKRRTREERSLSIEQIARREFQRIGMTATKDRTGILFFLLLNEHQFYILADEGINSKVEQGTWDALAKEMSSHFSKHEFKEGLIHAIARCAAILTQFFPRQTNDKNELSDDVRIS